MQTLDGKGIIGIYEKGEERIARQLGDILPRDFLEVAVQIDLVLFQSCVIKLMLRDPSIAVQNAVKLRMIESSRSVSHTLLHLTPNIAFDPLGAWGTGNCSNNQTEGCHEESENSFGYHLCIAPFALSDVSCIMQPTFSVWRQRAVSYTETSLRIRIPASFAN